MKYLQYKEIKTRGTFDFPLDYYHVRRNHPRYEMSYHWHSEYEIIRILEGSFAFNLAGRQIPALPGDVLFVEDGLLHGGSPKDCVYECIVFDMRLLMHQNPAASKYLQDITNHQVHIMPYFSYQNSGEKASFPISPSESCSAAEIRQHAEIMEKIHTCVWSIFDALQQKCQGYEFLVIGGLYQFFGLIRTNELFSQAPSLSTKNQTHMKQLKQAISLIEASYGDPISLEDLSRAAGMSPKYFCRFFQEMTHRTPIDYLNYYRIERACIELITTSQSMTEVAFNCGFNDISYFIKTFKKYKGTTPKRYLKEVF